MVEAAARDGYVPRPLRVPSLVFSSPANSQIPKWAGKDEDEMNRDKGDEVVPDSEEERLLDPEETDSLPGSTPQPQVEVIEIFSSDEDIQGHKSDVEDDPFVEKMPGSWPTNNEARQDSSDNKCQIPSKPEVATKIKNSSRIQTPRSRRIIRSSSSEDSENDCIDLMDSSPEKSSTKKPKDKQVLLSRPALKKPSRSAPEHMVPLYADDDEPWNVDDGSILTFEDAGPTRRPIRRTTTSSRGTKTPLKHRSTAATPSKSLGTDFVDLNSDDDFVVLPSVITPPSRTHPTPRLRGLPSTSSQKVSRNAKKTQAVAEQARREQYAAELFEELNRMVFNNGLPKGTKMNWNKRLLTTAGRAKWHRSRDGVHTTEIELATKILDSDERIRNTLSHEMCHLACWIINGDPKEGHGKVWKGWAAKVERKRPDIEVTTKHNYEISYPYEWECEQCAKVYGRFSKSIRPDECVCGACKVGKLVPLFSQPAPRALKTKAGSRMAPVKTQGSPCSIAPPSSLYHGEGTVAPHPTPGPEQKVYSDHPSGSDSDLEILTMVLGEVNISAGHS